MKRYNDNFPREINDQFRGNVIDNARMSQEDREVLYNMVKEYRQSKKSSDIKHGNSTVEKEIKKLNNRVKNQIIGANGNATAEVKDMRVDTQGQLHELAQDRLNEDFGRIDDIASTAKQTADMLETQMNTGAYYNEVSHFRGRKFDTTYYITHIPHLDSQGNIIKLKRGLYGNNPNKPAHMTPSDFARKTKATFVSNASTGSGSQLKMHGQQLFEGQILDSVKGDEYPALNDRWTLAIGDDNTLTSFPPDVQASEIRNKGYNNTVSGFGPIISDGKIIVKDGDYSPNTIVSHPRQVIAQLPNKDLIFFSCDGRENNTHTMVEKGMTLQEVAETLLDHYDIQFAYNMDGGGSTASVVRSHKLNRSMDDNKTTERKVLDFLYVGKEGVQLRDQDMQNAYQDIGEVRDMVQEVRGMLYSLRRISGKEFGTTGYDGYTGLLAFDDEGNPRKKIYQGPEGWRFWDYDVSRTIFRIQEDELQFNNRALARMFSAPETVTDINSVTYGGFYHVPRDAKGSPYLKVSSAMVLHLNVSRADFDDASTAFQMAIPFGRSDNFKIKRRTYAQGAWSNWFES
ncbi:phosphodiester glycosidase family protein [Mammaliicoccus sciuri]|uniref:phosphodiester glycosidase family protein n=1 Tax=Mammaliicoccus sciuri TaxID=1296 RepID=UPI001FB25FD6|nr:phosphodiester glycosidase family protein [Mammaliicoccus sciuri]MCJ1762185.1 phosphodiester glycosidase family protein [Mammaliicoccus sciuri]MEB7050069.1 phosphodiester glycosidase family protein [Mammaliicoccus sciuri]WQJ50718.1 phosphodiester glycosidase family protein [Mammaliicoccus sciuri]